LVSTGGDGDGGTNIALSDRRISGFAGCNTFLASVYVNNHRRITVGPIATTRKHCPAKMALEQRLLQVLSEAYSYQLKAKLLLLYSDQDVLLATFWPQSSEG
jgi:putative lipoprotein